MMRRLYQHVEEGRLYVDVDGALIDVTARPAGTALQALIMGCPNAYRPTDSEAVDLRGPGGPLSPEREEECLVAAVVDEGEGPGSPFEIQVWRERLEDMAGFFLGMDVAPTLYGPVFLTEAKERSENEVTAATAAARRREAAIADLHNLAILTNAMERLGIDTVWVEFDGYGDSGEVTAVNYVPRAPAGLPLEGFQEETRLPSGEWVREDTEPRSFGAATRDLVSRHLWQNYEKWVDDLGAGGTAEITKEGLKVHFARRVKSIQWEHSALHRPVPAPLSGGGEPGF